LEEKKIPVCDYEGSDYQATFWDTGERDYEDRVEAAALVKLLPDSGSRLLEIGAGAGRNTPRYSNFDHIFLLDYSFSQLSIARERLGTVRNLTFVAADVYRMPFTRGVFDCATMIRTIHHLVDVPRAFAQVRAALLQDSVFILEYANKQNIKSIARYLLQRQNWSPFSKEPVEFVELNFNFHPLTIRNWLVDSDFLVENQLTVSHFRMNTLKRHVPLDWLVRLDSAIQKTGNLWQLAPSVFVRSKALGGSAASVGDSVFGCPECRHAPLEMLKSRVSCPSCHCQWEIRDGIYDFRQPISR
jgi:ubiquinone/menaquinone biosynthesis C-methylase UbiE